MALDSNSPGDDRSGAGSAERIAGTGLKLVGSVPGTATGGAGQAAGNAACGASEGKGTSPGPAPTRRADRKQGRQLPLWLFGVLVALFVVGYGYQTHHASRLEAEVARLEGSLAKAETRLESHRTHLLEIRSGVHDLTSRLESLRVLIDRDPTAEPAKRPELGNPAAPRPNTP